MSVDEVAAFFGVSPSPVREALRTLLERWGSVVPEEVGDGVVGSAGDAEVVVGEAAGFAGWVAADLGYGGQV
ncbi:GntR family transcriptional regulator, partial [Kribbella albertanoniae]